MLIVYTHILYYIYVWIWIYIYIDMASVSGVGGSAGGSGGSDGSGGTGTAAIRGISKTSRGKKKVAKRVVNDPSLMPMPSIGTSGGAIPLYPEVPVEPYTLDEIMDPGCVDCYNRIVIIPEGDGYLPFKSSAKAIAEVIQEKYKKPWLSWGEIKEDKTPQIREVDQFLHCFKEKQLGREVTQAEIHRYLHVNPETNEYTDELSKNIQEQLQQIMKEWDDHQATLPPAQRAGPVQRKQYETASFMHISGGKYKGRVLGAGSLSSTFKKGPTGYIQTETSSSYASTDRSHRPSIDNDLDQLKKQWASEQEEKTQQLIQAAIDKLNEEWKQKFQEQQQQFQQQQQQFQQQQFSFPPVFHQQFPPQPQYLPQQPLFQHYQLQRQSTPTSPQCGLPLSDSSEEDETYFDESSGNSDDDIDDMEAEDQHFLPDFNPPSHLKSINLDTQERSSEFHNLFIDEVPAVDGTLEVGMKCRASKRKKSELWVIGKLNLPHTCTNYALSQDHTKLDSNMICASIMQVVKTDPSIKVKVIIAEIQALHNYTITYRKGWIGKNKAIEQIYGNWEKSYNQLPQWLLVMQTFAIGTKIEMETIPAYHENSLINGIRIFHRLFWAFVPCISAFKFCKPIVQVDGTWLYGKYKGTLLVAVAQDGDDNVIPIAYALVEGETKEGWSFFLRNLRKYVTPQPNICMISDRHESIKSAYNDPNNGWQDPPSKHMFCVRHISQNFAREFKDNALKKKVVSMGYSINDPTYRYYRREIGIVNPEALKWLDNIPRQDWIQAFDGETCINFMKLEISKFNSHRVHSFDRSNHTFMVHETVVPREGRPIGHFSVNLPNKCIKYDYWSLIPDVYKEETVLKVYEEAFPPIPNKGYWPQYEGIKLCHNPLMRRVKKGRPKSKRIKTEMDTTKRVYPKCGLCRVSGHTRKHCPNVAGTSTQI
ncbi:uncharacterized protein [Cicer arietinum]|uniref:uncharacterized protein n=1 Tax=Cicer arietinum TaxID=3827 RepID=UPI003CC509E3